MQASHTPDFTAPEETCILFEGSSLQVLLAARDLIHAGWRILHHPLYGNYRPYQQPYRSVLLEYGPSASVVREQGRFPGEHGRDAADGSSDASVQRVFVDPESLHFIEEALEVFRNASILTPDMAPPPFLKDCSMLDFELMRLPLQQAGLPDSYLELTA